MVEFAIVLPFLLLLTLGMVDMGRFFLLYTDLNRAVREGARLAAVSNPAIGSEQAAIALRVQATIRDAQSSSAAVLVQYSGAKPLIVVRVQIMQYPFRPLTPGVHKIFPATRTLTVGSQFRYELN